MTMEGEHSRGLESKSHTPIVLLGNCNSDIEHSGPECPLDRAEEYSSRTTKGWLAV